MKIKFTETYTVKSVGGVTYIKGSTYELPPDSAAHFISRGRAEAFVDAPVIPDPPKKSGDINPATDISGEESPSGPSQIIEEREITTNVDLSSLFEKQRGKLGRKQPK
jgi:hypothetical protein